MNNLEIFVKENQKEENSLPPFKGHERGTGTRRTEPNQTQETTGKMIEAAVVEHQQVRLVVRRDWRGGVRPWEKDVLRGVEGAGVMRAASPPKDRAALQLGPPPGAPGEEWSRDGQSVKLAESISSRPFPARKPARFSVNTARHSAREGGLHLLRHCHVLASL